MTQHNLTQLTPAEPETRQEEQNTTLYVIHRLMSPSPRFWTVVIILGILFLVGIISFSVRLSTAGLAQRAPWGYLMATLAFLLTTGQAAPIVAIGLRLTKADWRRQITRASELFAVTGVLSFLIYIPLLLALPPISGRHTLWINFPFGVPWLFDTIAMLVIVLHGLALLHISARPDFAAARDQTTGRWHRFYSILAFGWQGTPRQWTIHRLTLTTLGVLYLPMLGLVLLLVPADFAISLIPGWNSSIFPPYQLVEAIELAIATTVAALFLWYSLGGLAPYIRRDHFHGLGVLLLALGLLWLYMWWSDFITLWYGRTPQEQNLLRLLDFESYLVPWLLAFIFLFLVPVFSLIWKPVRYSILGVSLIAFGEFIGCFFDKVRFYVAAFSIEDVTAQGLETVPPAQLPDILDILMVLGILAGAVMLYLIATKIVPPLAIWEVNEGFLTRLSRRFVRGEYVVIGKPH